MRIGLYALLFFSLLIPFISASDVKDNKFNFHFDRITYNHFHDERGQLIFDQLLFERWDKAKAKFLIEDWTMMTDKRKWKEDDAKFFARKNLPYNAPLKTLGINHQTKNLTIYSKKLYHFIHIHFDQFKETWTQYDPELESRTEYPKEKRVQEMKILSRPPLNNPAFRL